MQEVYSGIEAKSLIAAHSDINSSDSFLDLCLFKKSTH